MNGSWLEPISLGNSTWCFLKLQNINRNPNVNIINVHEPINQNNHMFSGIFKNVDYVPLPTPFSSPREEKRHDFNS